MTPATHGDGVGRLGVGRLRAAYRDGRLTPAEVVDAVHARIAARGHDHVWIDLVPHAEMRARAAALDASQLDDLPLFGVPFAVKDNIDVGGMTTTAACPDFAHPAERSATVVSRLVAAGAVLVGKTNLDQFATGLSGARSPYGVVASVDDPALIAGGSSSGSAVAVAADQVAFAIGTDTAGSGRVPAALNGVVGLKPSIGLVGATGIVPACRSLDCPSVFAGTVADAAAVLAVAGGPDPVDPWSRRLPVPGAVPGAVSLGGLRLAVPAAVPRWGGRGEEWAWVAWCRRLTEAGVELVPVGLEAFWDAGRQLYDGPWVAERLDGLAEFVARHPDGVLPVTRAILERGHRVTGVEAFAGLTSLQESRRAAHALLGTVDALLTPTVTETFTITRMLADPVRLNSRLGLFTTFTNLLDLCAVAVPVGGAEVPFGVTVHAPAGHDAFLVALAAAFERVRDGDPQSPAAGAVDDDLLLAVVGAHLRGMLLHDDLRACGAEFVERTTTAPAYRLFALAGGPPERPGLRRVADGGEAIEVEVYRLPRVTFGAFISTVTEPLAIGRVTLAGGRSVLGFVCEPAGLETATDITRYGGWRAYRRAVVADFR